MENGKLVEYWGFSEKVRPKEESRNSNGMF
jgi:hypothetical protein